MVSLKSAWNTEKERVSVILKVMLSFATVSLGLIRAAQTSETYERASSYTRNILNAAGAATSMGQPYSSSSLDCLLGTPSATPGSWFLLEAIPPLALLLATCCGIFFMNHKTMGVRGMLEKIMLPTVVLGNCFLPSLLGAFMRFTPCVHLQIGAMAFAAYNLPEVCDTHTVRTAPLVAVIIPLCLLIGPVYWLALLLRSKMWKASSRRKLLGFLIAGFRDHAEWWEVIVLIRKMLLVSVAVISPVSYAPQSYLFSVIFVMGVSLVLHVAMRPYTDRFLNRVEGSVLAASASGALLTGIVTLKKNTWSIGNKEASISLVSLAVLLLSMWAFLVIELLKAVWTKIELAREHGSSTRETSIELSTNLQPEEHLL